MVKETHSKMNDTYLKKIRLDLIMNHKEDSLKTVQKDHIWISRILL